MFRGRSLRSGRTLRSRADSEDEVQLDLSREASENVHEVLSGACRRQGVTEGKRFAYLTALVRLLDAGDVEGGRLGYTVEEIQCCLRVCAVHEATQVRAAALRAVRYLLREERDVRTLYRLQYPTLIARSLDVQLRSDAERVQALRLARRLVALAPADFPPSVVRSLVSLANGAVEEKDRMLRACLAALAEICVLNPVLFVACGGPAALLRALFECPMPRIVEALCGAVLFLLNRPDTRRTSAVRLEALAAPYCDFACASDRLRDERDARFHCSRLALLSVLRSWPGVLHFCHPSLDSGLKALVGVLRLRQGDVRKAVLDLLYELLDLPQPEWTDEVGVALEAVDPSRPRESWKLSEGFVVAEGRAVLPHLAKCRPNVVEIQLAFLLYAFLEAGLLEALVEVVVTSDTFISVRATVLLGELLQLVHTLLPPECCDLSPALPALLAHAALGPDRRALQAMLALDRLHSLFKHRPAPASLFLDHLLQPSGRPARTRHSQVTIKDGEEALKESGVLTHKDGRSWDWTVIRALLKVRGEALRRMEDSSHRTFVKRLVHHLKPSSRQFSRAEAAARGRARACSLAACDLVDVLVEADEQSECGRLLADLVGDVATELAAISTSRSAHDCLFSPQHVANSLCQDYFLVVGRLTRTARGSRLLDRAGVFQLLLELVGSTNHDCYVKLVVSSLDYNADGMPRVVLGRALSGAAESSRLYATQYLGVLARAGLPDFAGWGVEMVVAQLYDQSRAVQRAAIAVATEATDHPVYLGAVVALRPSLLHLGDHGLLLLVRFLSTRAGFAFLAEAGFVASQLDRWANTFNYRYVRIVEGELHDATTLHRRGEDGRYSRRVTSARRQAAQEVLAPPHLYGQLAQHEAGMAALEAHPGLQAVVEGVLSPRWATEREILETKAALWALGNLATSGAGARLVASCGALAGAVRLAQSCPVYSLRGTALYALGLVATTRAGAKYLEGLGWLCVRHNRHERWPVVEPETEDGDGDAAVTATQGGGSEQGGPTRPGEAGSVGGRFYIPDGEEDESDEGLPATDWGPGSAARRCATLPPAGGGGGGAGRRHGRSHSESQPADGRWREAPTPARAPRERKRCSESLTDSSGVSSCDSVGLARPPAPSCCERHPTLSPIPSSTSLNARPRLSSRDLAGLATLRSLDRHRRPLLSDAFATSLRDRSDSGCEFEASSPPLAGSGASRASLEGARTYYGGRAGPGLRPAPAPCEGGDQCYMGIALPREVALLFPSPADADAFELPTRETDDPLAPAEEASSASDSEGEAASRPRHAHVRSRCLACRGERERARKASASSYSAAGACRRARADTESSWGAADSPLLFPRQRGGASGCLLGATLGASATSTASLDTAGSPQSLAGACEGEENGEGCTGGAVRAEVLRQVDRLANPVWGRQARQALLHLRQRFPAAFRRDVCLYSDVCHRMGAGTYRLPARRFIQELFLDLSFDALYEEPASILQLQPQPPGPGEGQPPAEQPPAPAPVRSPPLEVVREEPPGTRGPGPPAGNS